MTADSCRATRAAPRRVLASQAASGTSPALTPPPRAIYGLRHLGGDHVQCCAAAVRTWSSPNNTEAHSRPRQWRRPRPVGLGLRHSKTQSAHVWVLVCLGRHERLLDGARAGPT